MNSISRASAALGLLLVALQLPAESRAPQACLGAAESVARDGHTRSVACGAAAIGRSPLRGPARALFGLPFDLNRADAASLRTLPGIGPAKARAILEERAHRPFASVGGIVRVRGIGPVIAERLAGRLVVEPLQEKQ